MPVQSLDLCPLTYPHAESLSPTPQNVPLFGDSFYRCNYVKIRSWGRRALSYTASILTRRNLLDRYKQRKTQDRWLSTNWG